MADRLDIAECRAHAERMRHRAHGAADPRLRAGYEAMALAYDRLIADLEKELLRQAETVGRAAERASLNGVLF